LAYPDPPAESFGTRLKRLAKEKGLSNKDLARITGAHEVTVSRWMGGQEPKGEALLTLADALEVSPTLLLKGNRTKTGRFFEPEHDKPTTAATQRKRKGG